MNGSCLDPSANIVITFFSLYLDDFSSQDLSPMIHFPITVARHQLK